MKDSEIIEMLKTEIVKRSRRPESEHDFSGPEWLKICDIVCVIAKNAYMRGLVKEIEK